MDGSVGYAGFERQPVIRHPIQAVPVVLPVPLERVVAVKPNSERTPDWQDPTGFSMVGIAG